MTIMNNIRENIKMEWQDVEIIALRREEHKKKFADLNTGMFIKEQLIYFQKQVIKDMGFNIMLPSKYIMMAQEDISRKYPSVDRPNIVIGNDEGDVVFAFSDVQDHIKDDLIRENTILMIKTLLKSANPSINFIDEGALKNNYMSCVWLGFKSYVIGGSIYNFTNIVSFVDKTILGMFSCPYNLHSWWHPIFLKILNSIEVM